MYLGELVEIASSEEIFEAPRHPYTRALLSAALPLDPAAKRDPFTLQGEIPSPLRLPSGCFLCPRCPEAITTCKAEHPALLPDEGAAHRVRCFVANGDARHIP
jgi:oligopeptide transport system ATP-binding protein